MASKGGVIVVVSGEDKTGEVFNAVKKHLDESKQKAKETSESLGKIGESLKHGIEAAGVAIGAREIIGYLKEMVTSATEFGESLEKAQIKTGIAAGTLSVLHYAAATTGTDFEQLVKGAARMGKNMADAADGNKKLDKAFQSIGVNARDLVGRTDGIDIAFKSLGKTLAATESPAQRNQLLISLLGKSGMESAPAILNLAENFDVLKKKAQDAGVYLDQMSAEKLANLNHSLADVKQRVLGASVAFTEGIQPALDGCIKALSSLSGNTDIWTVAGKQMGLTIIPLAAAIGMMYEEIRQTSDEFRNNAAALNYLDAAIGVHLDLTQAQRDAAYNRREEARAEMHDTKMDHDLSIQEEKSFHDQLLALKNDIEHPSQAPSASPNPKPAPPPGDGPSGSRGGRGSAPTGDGLEVVPWSETALQSRIAYAHQLLEQARAAQKELFAEAAENAARAGQEAWDKMSAPDMASIQGLFPAAKAPTVTLAPQQADHSQAIADAEKFAHGIFDPLFSMSERWDQRWKQMRANMLRDLSQEAESRLFGAIFGDASGSGGKGLDGSKGNPKGHNGLLSDGLGLLGGLFQHKGAGTTSNGGLGSGAGTIASAAASAMQMGGGAAAGGSGGIQVVLNNQGSPMQVSQTQQSGGDGGEQQVIQIMLKQLETNGPVAQGIAGLMMLA